jgi:hypothetical protein
MNARHARKAKEWTMKTLWAAGILTVTLAGVPDAASSDSSGDVCQPEPISVQKTLSPDDSVLALGEARFMFTPVGTTWSAKVAVTRLPPSRLLPRASEIAGDVYHFFPDPGPTDVVARVPLVRPVPAGMVPRLAWLDWRTGHWHSVGGLIIEDGRAVVARVLAPLTTLAVMYVSSDPVAACGGFISCGGNTTATWKASVRGRGEVCGRVATPPAAAYARCAGSGSVWKVESAIDRDLTFTDTSYSLSTTRQDHEIVHLTRACVEQLTTPIPGPGPAPPPVTSCAALGGSGLLTPASPTDSLCAVAGADPLCRYTCVGDFTTGCVCTWLNPLRNSVETGSYTVADGQLTTTRASFTGGPGSIGPLPEGPKPFCSAFLALRLHDGVRLQVLFR